MRPTPFMHVQTLSRTVLTAWPSRSPSWTPAWRRVSSSEICNLSVDWACNFLLSYSVMYSLMLYSKPLLYIKLIKPMSCCFAVSLQDINMRKAFKSSTVQDQQVLSKGSMPNSVAAIYNNSDRPPPLSTLTAYRYWMCCKKLIFTFSVTASDFMWEIALYREDSTDAMKFYSDPSYFFELWKEKMLQDTEDKRKERRRQRVKSLPTALFLCI